MAIATLTSKGQTTIPKEIRDEFHLKPHDKLLYASEKDRIIIKPLTGTILDLKGAFPIKGKLNFRKLRERMKREIAKETLKEMSR